MKFTVESSKLMQFLKAASKVIQQKNNTAIPILSNVLFEINGSLASLTAADITSRMESHIELVNSDMDGAFTVSEQILSNSIRELPDQPITFDVDMDTFEISLTYNNGFFRFKGEGAEAYPSPYNMSPDAKEFSLPTEALSKGIKGCKYAASTDDKRPIMTGVCIDFDPDVDGVVYVATDGKILVRYIDGNTNPSGVDGKYCVSSSTCSIITDFVLPKGKDMADICVDDNYIRVKVDGTTFYSRLLDGKYPNYNPVIPKENPFEVLVDKAMLQGACRRVSICSNSSNNLLVFHIKDDKIEISANNLEQSASAQESVLCSISDKSMDLKLGFDYSTFSKILDNTPSNEIKITLADQTRAVLVLPNEKTEGLDLCALIMPLRVMA